MTLKCIDSLNTSIEKVGKVRKILKISDKTIINSECWTYYKFAIMQTSNYFEA